MNWGLFFVLQKGSLHQREMQGARSYEMLLFTQMGTHWGVMEDFAE